MPTRCVYVLGELCVESRDCGLHVVIPMHVYLREQQRMGLLEGEARALWGMYSFPRALVQSTTNRVGGGRLKQQKSLLSQFGRLKCRWVQALS